MVKITEDMIRKRAEHNNMEISTLEEVSLHQQDIEKIENVDKWCRDLKILYLQSNLIPKIENVGRLKKLEYINLALNNIERVENLENCESLKKLDLTINFVGELSSIECLKSLEHFEELYLTGNPCTDFDGYRSYVVATLKKLKQLDGTEIEKSERIKALQEYDEVRPKILQQQEAYRLKREIQKAEASGVTDSQKNKGREETLKKFTEEEVPYTPESRIQMHEEMKELKKREEGSDKTVEKAPRRLFTDDGHALNINEPKLDFKFTENEDENTLIFELAVWKHLDTSFLDIDVQPTYIRVTVKGKIVQLSLSDEVKPDSSKALRSNITGALVVTMPKLHGEPRKKQTPSVRQSENVKATQFLEFSDEKNKPDFRNIVENNDNAMKRNTDSKKIDMNGSKNIEPVSNSSETESFIDNPDVPPLI